MLAEQLDDGTHVIMTAQDATHLIHILSEMLLQPSSGWSRKVVIKVQSTGEYVPVHMRVVLDNTYKAMDSTSW